MNSNIRAVVREVEKSFKKANKDGGGGLDMEEFSAAVQAFYPTYSKEELIALHMQIDTNCNGTVNYGEFTAFELGKLVARRKMDFERTLFSLPMKKVEVSHRNKIVQIIFRSCDKKRLSDKKYSQEEYLSVSSDGLLNFWTKRFDKRSVGSVHKEQSPIPYSHKFKVHVNDMVYIKERQEVAIATREKELCFYTWISSNLVMKYSLMIEGGSVTALNYWSNGTKAVFSYGDSKGYLYVFISYNIEENGLFYAKAFARTQHESYSRVSVRDLLKNTSRDYLVVKMPMFDDECSLIKYFPLLQEFGVCNQSSTKLVLAALPKSTKEGHSKKVFKSPTDEKIFTCVEYCIETQEIVTGGLDGILRTWLPCKTLSHKAELGGHKRPITFLLHNPKKKVIICMYEDQVISIWSLEVKQCFQTINVEGLGENHISSVCYSLKNNELVIANTNIGIYLGKGTDLFKEMQTSHAKPLCSAMYHSMFQQVVSVCQKGLLTVWDVNSGKILMQFNVSPDKMVATTAMAFDESRRKLVTVCNDGKVRFWNFNNGKELQVHPITVPRVVTGIVCTEERVFVSGKHSNILYNLDLNNKTAISMEHPFMKGGISCLAYHPGERQLFTASENGYIFVWDVNSCEAHYYINSQESSKIQLIIKKKGMGTTRDLTVGKKAHMFNPVSKKLPKTKTDIIQQSKVFNSPLIVCLKTRHVDFDRATLLVVEGCYICAWSVKAKGGLLAKFKATEGDAFITTMDTDANDSILMLGDSKGCVSVWDIKTYGDKKCEFKEPFEKISGWKVSLSPPLLLYSWKAQSGPVMSVTCNPSCENFITAGWDCNLHLWTNKQRCVGTFGKDQWDNSQLSPDSEAPAPPIEKPEKVYLEMEPVPKKRVPVSVARSWPKPKPVKSRMFSDHLRPYYEFDCYLWSINSKPHKKPHPHHICDSSKEKEIHKNPVRHFLEVKQFQEFPRLYNITCPHNGPITEQNLIVDENYLKEMKIDLQASLSNLETSDNGSASSSPTTSEESPLSPSKDEAEHIITPSVMPPTDAKEYSAARQREKKQVKKVVVKKSEVLLPPTKDKTELPKISTQLIPAPVPVEKRYHYETQRKYRELYIEWENERSKIKSKNDTMAPAEVKAKLGGETPFIQNPSTPHKDRFKLADNEILTPGPPSHKKGYSPTNQARLRARYGRQQKETSQQKPKGTPLTSVSTLDKLTVNGTRLTPPNDKEPQNQARFETVLSRTQKKESKVPLPTKPEVLCPTITPLPKQEIWESYQPVWATYKHMKVLPPSPPDIKGNAIQQSARSSSKGNRTILQPHPPTMTVSKEPQIASRSCISSGKSHISHQPHIKPPLMPLKEESFKKVGAEQLTKVPLANYKIRGTPLFPVHPGTRPIQTKVDQLVPRLQLDKFKSMILPDNSPISILPRIASPPTKRREESLRDKHLTLMSPIKPNTRGPSLPSVRQAKPIPTRTSSK